VADLIIASCDMGRVTWGAWYGEVFKREQRVTPHGRPNHLPPNGE